MTGTPCQLCARPTGDDATVCTSCAQQAHDALRQVAGWLATDLEAATARQTALGGRTGGKPTKASESPLPINLRASEAATVLRSTLVGWVRVVHEDGSHSHLPGDTLPDMARWLIPVIGWVRSRPYGAEMVDEILAAVAQARRAVDRPTRRVPLHTPCRAVHLDNGAPVPCGGELVAIIAPGMPIDGQVRCTTGDPGHTTTVVALADRRRAPRLAST